MRRPGIRRVGVAAAALLGLAVCLGASRAGAAMPSQQSLQQLVDNRQQIVRKVLNLDPQQQAAFEPLFATYESERTALANQRNGFVDDFSKADAQLSAEQADAMLDRFERLRRERVELDEKFRPRFEAAISPQKTLLLFQLNFILDAVVNYDLAGMIPLTR